MLASTRSGFRFIKSSLLGGVGAAAMLISPITQSAHANAVIFNNADPALRTLALGVNDAGNLNIFDSTFTTSNAGTTGLARLFADGTWRDATSPGCLCEGWGVAASSLGGGRFAGWANQNSGSGGLTGGLFGSTITTATSQIDLADLPIRVLQAYGPSLAPNAFQGNVSITNTGTEKVYDVVYRRVMDWDVPPTEFHEFVSHIGVEENLESVGGNVRFASNNGFASSDPRSYPYEYPPYGTINSNFFQKGPSDHGSVFDFTFGDLDPGQSRTFNIFYGAGANLPEALSTIAILKPDVWSIGQSTLSGTPNNDSPTFLFAFGGVGGVEPGTTPDVPVLPFVPAPGVFEFPAPAPRRWFDPPFVDGFDYSLGSGDFLSFILPPGFGTTIDLYVDDILTASDLTADGLTEYFFSAYGLSGVKAFSLRDISPLVDAADSTAFPTFLDFTSGATGLSMRARDGAPASVPGPLPALGLSAAFAFSRKLRGRVKAAAQ
ncbi:MAG: hypothetical protein RLZZ206_1044 [Cyanobacteriota bacterium]|jgi:hypothetical protein